MVPKGFWEDKDNHKAFLTKIGEDLGYTKPEDWHKIKADDLVKQKAGRHLLYNHYSGSIQNMLSTVFPDHDWGKIGT